MAYIAGIAYEPGDGSFVTNIQGPSVDHQTDDILIVWGQINRSGATFSAHTTPAVTGWAAGGSSTGRVPSQGIIWKRAASGSETWPAIAHDQASNTMACWSLVIRGCPTSGNPFDGSAANNASSDMMNLPAFAVSQANNLIMAAVCNTADAECFLPESDARIWLRGDNGVSAAQTMIAYTFQPATGSTPTMEFHNANLVEGHTALVIAIKDDGNGDFDGGSLPTSKPATLLCPMHCNTTSSGAFTEGNYLHPTEDITDPTTGAGSGNVGTVETGQTTAFLGSGSVISLNYAPAYGPDFSVDPRPRFVRYNLNSSTYFNRVNVFQQRFANQLDLSGSIISVHQAQLGEYTLRPYAEGGFYFGFMTGTTTNDGARIWKTAAGDTVVAPTAQYVPFQIAVDNAGYVGDFGTFNSATIDKFIYGVNVSGTAAQPTMSYLYELGTMTLVGGSATTPCSFASAADHAMNTSGLRTIQRQGEQGATTFYCAHSIKIGGTANWPVYFVSANEGVEYPQPYDADTLNVHCNVSAGDFSVTIDAVAGDYISLGNSVLNMVQHDFIVESGAEAASDVFECAGFTLLNANAVTLADIGTNAWAGAKFLSCAEVTGGADMSGGATFESTTGTQAISVSSQAEIDNLDGCTFTNNSKAVTITGNHTALNWMDNATFSGNTVDIRYEGATNLTVTVPQTTTGVTTGEQGGAGTLTIVTQPDTFTINSSEASTLIQIFTTNTQTLLDSTTGSSLAYEHTGETVDYVLQKAGFLPQRFTGVVLTNSSVSVTLVADPIYDSGHGLTIVTDYDYNRVTRVMTIVAAQQGRDLYSSLLDEFRTNSTYYNDPFPLLAIGPDRIDFTSDGTTASTIDSGDVQFWRGAGMEWEHATTGNPTHKYASVKGVGTNAAGTKGYYRFGTSGAPTAMSLVSNNADQVIQYYSDPDGDGTPTTDNSTDVLVVKLFNEGYTQARVEILAAFGISALESFEYTVSLQGSAFGYSSGDQGITIATLTDHTAAPINPGGGTAFSFELVDPGTNTSEELAAQLNYDIHNDPTATLYTSYLAFDLPDIIVGSAGADETVEGWVENEADTLGFYVSRSAADHPDFTRFEDDDGNYYTPAVTANVAVDGLQNNGSATRTLLQIFNTTAATSSAWAATTAYSIGDRVLRTTGLGTEQTGGLWFLCTTAGTSGGSEPSWDTTPGNTTADGTVVWTTYAALVYNADPAAASYSDSYTDGEEYASGDIVRVRHAEVVDSTSLHTAETTATVATSGWSVTLAPEADLVYAANGVDGSLYTGVFSLDVTAMEFDIIADSDFTAEQAYAWYGYELCGANGMHLFWGGVTAIDASNYRLESDIVDVHFDETASAFIKQIASGAGIARIFRSDGTRPAKDPTSGGYGIEINWQNPVYLAETGSVTAEGVAAEVISQLDTTAHSEPAGAPAANAPLGKKLGYLFMALRNKITVTASSKTFHDDDGNAEFSKSLSDNGTTYTEDEAA